MCTKFQESHGVLILAFYDPRHLAQAEAHLRTPGACQSLFGNAASSGLSVQKVGTRDLNKVRRSAHSPFFLFCPFYPYDTYYELTSISRSHHHHEVEWKLH